MRKYIIIGLVSVLAQTFVVPQVGFSEAPAPVSDEAVTENECDAYMRSVCPTTLTASEAERCEMSTFYDLKIQYCKRLERE